MKRIGVLLILTFFGISAMMAQQHRERWKAMDFFPEHHFVPSNARNQRDSIRTADTFKANFTNMAGRKFDALYTYLISLAGIEADYASEYCD